MKTSSILNNPHSFGKSLNIPYSYLNSDNKRFIFHSVKKIIAPKLQDILRQGKRTGNLPFLNYVFGLIEQSRNNYNFSNIGEYIELYISIIKDKYQIQKRIAYLLSLGNTKQNKEELKLFIKNNFEIEAKFFAYGALVKEFSERLMNYFLHLDPNLEGIINSLVGGSFYREFLSSCDKFSLGIYNRDQLINEFFNGEFVFFEEFMKTFKLMNGGSQSLDLPPVLEESLLPNPPLFKKLIVLLTIDNTIDKYIEFKKMFLHDILALYSETFGGDDFITEEKLERIIEDLFRGTFPTNYTHNSQVYSCGLIKLSNGILHKGIGGNKGYNLSILINNGINVPNGIVLSNELISKINDGSISEQEVINLINFIKNNVGTRLVVRSNYIGEDDLSKSYAGIFNSFLDVDINNVLEYIKKVINFDISGVNNYSTSQIKPGVLIQEFIDGDHSGVAFVNGDNIVMEVVKGLNCYLVNGEKTPVVYSIEGDNIQFNGGKLDDNLVSALKSIFKKLYQIFGNNNIDIEFTIVNGEVYILQVRPITVSVELCKSNIECNFDIDVGNIKLVSKGEFVGNICIVEKEEDIENINSDCIVITNKLYTYLAFKTRYIKGIISEEGGYLAHLSIVCREMKIPLLTNLFGIIDKLGNKLQYKTVLYSNNVLNFL